MMMTRNRAHLCALTAIVLGAPGPLQARQSADPIPPGVTPEMIARGREVFEGVGLCANCHGPSGMGLLGPNLTDADWWHVKGSYLAIVNQIVTGVPAERSSSGVVMPPRGGGQLSDADVHAVAAWVWQQSHAHYPADSLPPGVTMSLVSQGRQIFLGRGNCATCHGTSGTGAVGPNLTDDDWLHAKGSYLAIVGQIVTGVPAERSRSGTVMLPRGGANLSDDDVHAVAAYVWSISRRP